MGHSMKKIVLAAFAAVGLMFTAALAPVLAASAIIENAKQFMLISRRVRPLRLMLRPRVQQHA